jgi:putative ubiquitin-RnfH superfamily antitoxin RatB of RatAB toxin-antitoxin module
MKIDVVYALPATAQAVTLSVPAGTTVREAVAAAGLPAGGKFGIFGRIVAPETRVADGDRVEIYRPLKLDPKEARRRRARKKP